MFGLRADKGKSVIVKGWNIVGGKWNKVPIIEKRDTTV